jgi:hypothetical protein
MSGTSIKKYFQWTMARDDDEGALAEESKLQVKAVANEERGDTLPATMRI